MSAGWNDQDGDQDVELSVSSPVESLVSSPVHKRLRAALAGETQDAEGAAGEEASIGSAITVDYSPSAVGRLCEETCSCQEETPEVEALPDSLLQLNLRQQAQQWWNMVCMSRSSLVTSRPCPTWRLPDEVTVASFEEVAVFAVVSCFTVSALKVLPPTPPAVLEGIPPPLPRPSS